MCLLYVLSKGDLLYHISVTIFHPRTCFQVIENRLLIYPKSAAAPLLFLSGILIAHYLQSITPALALGGELVYHSRPGEEGSVMSLVGRYTGEAAYCSKVESNEVGLHFHNVVCHVVKPALTCRPLYRK